MDPQASVIDVPASVNGRSCNLSVNAQGLTFRYKRSQAEITITRENVKTSVTRGDMLAVNLVEPMHVVPGTAKATRNVLLHRQRFLDDSVWRDTVDSLALYLGSLNYEKCNTITTACGSRDLQISACASAPIVVWESKACVVTSDVRAVILQRTSGGMSTYDVHVLPCADAVLSINMLDHKSLPVWRSTFSALQIVDTGPSQVSLQDAEAAQHEEDFRYYLCGTDISESEEESEDELEEEFVPNYYESEDSESMNSGSDSDSCSNSMSECSNTSNITSEYDSDDSDDSDDSHNDNGDSDVDYES